MLNTEHDHTNTGKNLISLQKPTNSPKRKRDTAICTQNTQNTQKCSLHNEGSKHEIDGKIFTERDRTLLSQRCYMKGQIFANLIHSSKLEVAGRYEPLIVYSSKIRHRMKKRGVKERSCFPSATSAKRRKKKVELFVYKEI